MLDYENTLGTGGGGFYFSFLIMHDVRTLAKWLLITPAAGSEGKEEYGLVSARSMDGAGRRLYNNTTQGG